MKRQLAAVRLGSIAIDAAAGIISGVSVITTGEALGHGAFVDLTTLEQVKTAAMEFAGGVKVKLNHTSDVSSIVGYLKNFRIDGEQLRADLHLFKAADDYEMILELAQVIPDTFGFSISFSGPLEEVDGRVYLRCTELYSVDLVDSPAANPDGLLSQVDSTTKHMDIKEVIAKVTGLESTLNDLRKDLAEQRDKAANSHSEAAAKAGQVTQLEANLATARQTISTLETTKRDLEAAKTTAETKVLEMEKRVADQEKDFERRANLKSAEVLRTLGIAPIKEEKPQDNPAATQKPKVDPTLKGLARAIAAHQLSYAQAK